MSMTRKHFVAIAETVKEIRPLNVSPRMGYWRYIAEEFARTCSRQNPDFDRDRFLRACGYYG